MLSVVVLLSCGRDADRAANDSGTSTSSLRSDSTVPAPVFREWRARAGRYLLVAAEPPETALVVFPEFTLDSSLTSALFVLNDVVERYDLFAPDGSATLARLTNVGQTMQTGCERWPTGRVEPLGEPRPWTVGLQTGHARGIAYVPLDRLSGQDSAAIVVTVTRLASQAPNDTVSALRGLPYVVRSAYTAVLPDSLAWVFAELVRRVNIEASPHEERAVIVGERDLKTGSTRHTLAFSERHTGDEESVPTTELIGLVQLVDGTIAALAARDYSDGGIFLMLERQKEARWRVRWQSAYAGC